MEKKVYIIPAVVSVALNVEHMMATSGPEVSSKSAVQGKGMDSKDQGDYDVWDE